MNADEPTFEQSLAELDAVVNDLESGTLSLDDALARYELGVKLLRGCNEKLKQAEQKIQQLTGVDENGQPVLAPFPGANDVQTAARRPRKKTDPE